MTDFKTKTPCVHVWIQAQNHRALSQSTSNAQNRRALTQSTSNAQNRRALTQSIQYNTKQYNFIVSM